MNKTILISELKFKAVRSSGAGGQHVNKVSSKMELFFDLENSAGLSENEKTTLKSKISSKLTKENILMLSCQETRSQHNNKSIVIERFFLIISANRLPDRKRRKTKPTRSSVRKRLDSKKIHSNKKETRKKVNY